MHAWLSYLCLWICGFSTQVKAAIQIFPSSLKEISFITISYPKDDKSSDLREAHAAQVFQFLLCDRLQKDLQPRVNIHYPNKSFVEPSKCSVSMSCTPDQLHQALAHLHEGLDQIKQIGFSNEELSQAKEKIYHDMEGNQPLLEEEKTTSRSGHAMQISHELIDSITLDEVSAYSKQRLIDTSPEIQIVTSEEDPSMIEQEVMQLFENNETSFDRDLAASTAIIQDTIKTLPAPERAEEEILLIDVQQPSLEKEQEQIIAQEKQPSLDPANPAKSNDAYSLLAITDEEKKLIGKLLITMAENNVFELLFEKKKLERIGRKINRVHPMRFLGTVFTDPRLIYCIKEIKKSSFKWEGFIEGFSHRMSEEFEANNLLPYVPGFASALNVDEERVTFFVKKNNFEGLVIFLTQPSN